MNTRRAGLVAIAGAAIAVAAVAPAWADNMPPSPPPTAAYSPPATSHSSPSPTPPPVIRNPAQPGVVVSPGPRTQTQPGGGGSVQPQAPAENWIDPSLTEAPPEDFADQSPTPQIGLSGNSVPAGPAPTAPAATDEGSDIPIAPIGAALALAGGLALLAAGLRRRPDPCEQAMRDVALRCQGLKDAIMQVRLAESRLEVADAELGPALAAEAYVPFYRRERHHARDDLLRATARLDVEQRLYDEVQATAQARCGICPPCVPSDATTFTPVTTPA